MSLTLQDNEDEHGFLIDEYTYYHPDAGLKGWTIHTCCPPKPALEPLLGKRITNTKPPPSFYAKKKRPNQLDLNNNRQQPPAKKAHISQMNEIIVAESSSQAQQRTPTFQEQQDDIQPQASPTSALSASQHIIASTQTDPPRMRRKLPPRGVPQPPRRPTINYPPSQTSNNSSSQTNTPAPPPSSSSSSLSSNPPRRIYPPAAPSLAFPRPGSRYDPELYKNLSDEQKNVHDQIVKHEKSVFFTGSAGTGKSVLLKTIINSLHYKLGADLVAVTASTGIAACNIGGVTLHSELGIGIGEKSAEDYIKIIQKKEGLYKKINTIEVLIIDEISMIDGVLFDKIDTITQGIRRNKMKAFGGIRLVLCGDFYQLPPINKNVQDVRYAFQANCWRNAIDLNMELSIPFRQKDKHFADMLNELRLGKVSRATERGLKNLQRTLAIGNDIEPTELYPLRKELEAANNGRLNSLSGEPHIFRSVDEGNSYLYNKCIAPEILTLKVGAQVMLVKNLTAKLVNGSRGVVSRFAKEEGKLFPVVKFSDGTEQTITNFDFVFESQGKRQASRKQIPLILAWALSIHKSQGQTIEYLKIDLKESFDYGQAYVALSRATCMENLQVSNFSSNIVKSHPKVVEFYRKMTIDK